MIKEPNASPAIATGMSRRMLIVSWRRCSLALLRIDTLVDEFLGHDAAGWVEPVVEEVLSEFDIDQVWPTAVLLDREHSEVVEGLRTNWVVREVDLRNAVELVVEKDRD